MVTAPILEERPPPRPAATAPAVDPFAKPFLPLVMGLLAPGLAILAPLVPLGMAPLLITLSVLAGGLVLWRTRRLPPLPRDLLLPLALFWAFGTVSIAWTPVPIDGLAQSITFLYELVPGFLLMGMAWGLGEGERARVRRLVVGAFAVGLTLYAVESLFGQPLYHLAKALEGTNIAQERALNRPSVIFTVLVWPVALLLWQQGRRKAALLLPPAYFLLTLATPSASAVAGMAGGVLLLPLAWHRPRWALGLVGALLVGGFLFCVPIAGLLAGLGLEKHPDFPFSFAHRIDIWQFAADRASERPWLGWGLDASRAIPEGNRVTEGLAMERPVMPLHPHNLFLQARLELGWVGSALLAWFGLVLLARIGRLPHAPRAFALSCYASAVLVACFAYGAWQTWWVCTLLLAGFLFVGVARRPEVTVSGSGSRRPPP